MSAAENKQLVKEAFAGLERGDGRGFVGLLSEDVRWTILGDTAWSRTWKGLSSVRAELLDPLFAQFATTYRAELVRQIAEDDWVVIEFRGDVITKDGEPYRNAYCYVCRLEDGKVKEITEYCDTQLLTKALAPPERRVIA
jgi:uncharacterized protein